MSVSFQAVTLDTDTDREATLVFRDGRLLGVLTCLSDIHGELSGRWFVEAVFGDVPSRQPQAHSTLDAFAQWLANAE